MTTNNLLFVIFTKNCTRKRFFFVVKKGRGEKVIWSREKKKDVCVDFDNAIYNKYLPLAVFSEPKHCEHLYTLDFQS